jgi:transposase
MSNDTLFPIEPPPQESRTTSAADRGAPRVLVANRRQVELRPCDLEALLPADHPARAIWAVVEQLDLSRFYETIEARAGQAGRPAIDPKILVALWLYATSEGEGSAREIARRCEVHDAYRWICGGVSINYHTLSDFRIGHPEALDGLMTQLLAVLMHQGLVKIQRVAQDGMRVRASAGAASFRREPTLNQCFAEAQEQVERTKRRVDDPAVQGSARRRAAQDRAAREREQRIARALAELPKVEAVKASRAAKEKARVSTTDPEARVMKMADGGFRPAYNVQLATDTESRVIVGANVTNVGSDRSQLEPMLGEIERRTDTKPEEHLVDGGFVRKESIENAAAQGVTVLAPVRKPQTEEIDPHQRKPGESDAVGAWRERMGTAEAKETYKLRASTAETVNADLRCSRGLDRFTVRGSAKVLMVVLWSALAYNVLRGIAAGVLG